MNRIEKVKLALSNIYSWIYSEWAMITLRDELFLGSFYTIWKRINYWPIPHTYRKHSHNIKNQKTVKMVTEGKENTWNIIDKIYILELNVVNKSIIDRN